MLVFLSIIFLIGTGITILLVFNKSKEAEGIKSVLKEILGNLKDLFINLKDLTLLLIAIIQNTLQEKNDSSEENQAKEIDETKIKESLKPSQVIPDSSSFTKDHDEGKGPEMKKSEENVHIQEPSSPIEAPLNDQIEIEKKLEISQIESDISNQIDHDKTSPSSDSKDVIAEINDKDEDIAS